MAARSLLGPSAERAVCSVGKFISSLMMRGILVVL